MPYTPEERRLRKRAYMREYRRTHREAVLAISRKYERNNRLTIRARQGARRIAQLEAAAGRPKPKCCDICGGTDNIQFDHCHQRGVFRGWLCWRCNSLLGMINDNANHLRQLIAYLERTAAIISPQLTLPGI